jgi:hypothetical protein
MAQLTENNRQIEGSARGRKPRVAPGTLAVFADEWFKVFYAMRYGLGPAGPYDSRLESEVVEFVPRPFSPIPELAKEQMAAAFEEEIIIGSAVFASGPEGGEPVAHIDLDRMKTKKVRGLGIPSERELYQRLVRARTGRRVRMIFNRSVWLQNKTKPFLRDLFDHAEKFADALRRHRFPASSRPSSQTKQLIFLASAMTSISWGLSPSTGIAILRRMRWEPPKLSYSR